MKKAQKIYNHFKGKIFGTEDLTLMQLSSLKKELESLGIDASYCIDEKDFRIIKTKGENDTDVFKVENLYCTDKANTDVVNLYKYCKKIKSNNNRVCLTKYFGLLSFTSVFDDGKFKEINIVDQENNKTITLSEDIIEDIYDIFIEHTNEVNKLKDKKEK